MQDSIRKQLHNYVSFFVIMLGLLIFIPVMAIERIETTNEAKEQLDLVLQSKAFFLKNGSKNVPGIFMPSPTSIL